MRLAARDLDPSVTVSPETGRPIRMRTGALTYMMTPAEAIALATDLADAVSRLRAQENQQ
ncbi:hypothetical protein HZU38_29395 [Mycolicibacterium vanbaalenii]|uniref:hypothetical protein n=1 Tax=Mycolicibacterium vanbaalenii TaxID=110539 RepID=UPI001F3D4EAA|nr:hypothetical protein [Mycolicibacterium vanbaalenii]UJL28853.1 hypothetical protein HZU38_29395 [Mycolicibacterium vanbaalenii]WND55565.1 hypothetical protein QQA43_22990 [Mycolicibacterium vanbaalenii]